MSCIAVGNKRCTKCCEAIHIATKAYFNLWKPSRATTTYTDGDKIRSYWLPISKRRAKKINPCITTKGNVGMSYFKCKKLTKGIGCSVHSDKPQVCLSYTGGTDYSESCVVDINIIARS